MPTGQPTVRSAVHSVVSSLLSRLCLHPLSGRFLPTFTAQAESRPVDPLSGPGSVHSCLVLLSACPAFQFGFPIQSCPPLCKPCLPGLCGSALSGHIRSFRPVLSCLVPSDPILSGCVLSRPVSLACPVRSFPVWSGPVVSHPVRLAAPVLSGPVRSGPVSLVCPFRSGPVLSGHIRSFWPVRSSCMVCPVRSGPIRSGPVRLCPAASGLTGLSCPVRSCPVLSGLVRRSPGLSCPVLSSIRSCPVVSSSVRSHCPVGSRPVCLAGLVWARLVGK